MHFHRDMLATCDTYGAHVLRARPTMCSSAARRSRSPSALARPCCFRCASAPAPSCWNRRRPMHVLDAIRTMRPTVCFTAPTAYRAMLGTMRPGDVASLRICVSAGEALAEADLGRMARGDRSCDHGRHRLHRNAAHLHRRTGREDQARCDRHSGARLRGQADRRARQRPAARQHRAPGCARPDRLPLSRRCAADRIRAERLEHYRRHLPSGRGRLLLVPGALRRHDPVVRLQHLRARKWRRHCYASGGRGMRRGGRTRRGARHDRQGLCRAARS